MQEAFGTKRPGPAPTLLLFVVVSTALLLVGVLIFRNFLFGDSVLLYTDIGSDSLKFSYPQFVHFSDYIRHEGVPSWSFCVGMGQDIFYLDGVLSLHPVAWLHDSLLLRLLFMNIWPGACLRACSSFPFFNCAI
jgi:hypothetical protein